MTTCLVCQKPQCAHLIDFGHQPVCHRFLDHAEQDEKYRLVLGQCENCGLVQLTERIAPEKMVPHFDWITNNEPEGHLDELVSALRGLPGITPSANICGISPKDDSALRRFREQGFQTVWRIDPAVDLGLANGRGGIESIQQRLEPSLADVLRKKYGAPDLLIARHVLEHTHDTVGFMETLRRLINSTGYVVFEVPDCARPLDFLDYTALWEEHSLYFSEATLRTCLTAGAFSPVRVERYLAPYEIAVVAVAKPRETAGDFHVSAGPKLDEWQRTLRFARSFDNRRRALRAFLSEWRSEGKIAMFGAGHHAVMFLNLIAVADLVEFVVDDHPHKRGLRMPGSRLPIVGSENLMQKDIKFCLSSLGFGSERKVMDRHQAFLRKGGTFASIFPSGEGGLVTLLGGQERHPAVVRGYE